MDTKNIKPSIPEHSYFIGFSYADGHLQDSTRNRGKFSIELKADDSDILEEFSLLFSEVNPSISFRQRDTNFSKDYRSCCFRICSREFRDNLKSIGFHSGKKSYDISMPDGAIRVDYIRGLIDGDGSIGFTAKRFPFVSFVTVSKKCSEEYIEFLYSVTGKRKTTTRNKRDRAFNIAVYKEDAQAVTKALYYEGCLSLKRKHRSAIEVMSWERPGNMRIAFSRKRWTKEQDEFIKHHSVEESMLALDRTKSSVKTHLWRLNK